MSDEQDDWTELPTPIYKQALADAFMYGFALGLSIGATIIFFILINKCALNTQNLTESRLKALTLVSIAEAIIG